jgi:hypothetical protein
MPGLRKMAGAASEVAKNNMADQMEFLLEDFVDFAGQFMSAIVEVFPECPYSRTALAVFKAKTLPGPNREKEATKAIMQWHAEMEPYYVACQDSQDSVMSVPFDLFLKLKIKEKWSEGLHPDTKAATFEYLTRLNDCAAKYASLNSITSAVPRGVLSSVESVAANLIQQIENGEKGLGDINFQQITQDMMSAMDPAALEAYRDELMNTPGGPMAVIGQLMGNVGSLMRDAPPEAQPLVANMMSLVGSTMPK